VRRLREHDRGPQVGDRIPVTYDPADPAVVMPVSEVGYWRALPGLLLVLAVALGLGYLGLTVFLGDFPGLRHLTALWRARSPG
jgi:hypothetical protein